VGELAVVRPPRTGACPFCGGPGPFPLVCGTCATGHHAECWRLSGGCAVEGCASRLDRDDTPPRGLDVVVVDVEAVEDDGAPRRRAPAWAWWAAGAALLLLAGSAALFASTRAPAPEPTVEPLIVPQVEGLDFSLARDELQALGLLLTFEMVPTEGVEAGVVVEQSLAPLSQALPGDTIDLVVAAEVPETPTPTPTPARSDGTPSEAATVPAAPPAPTPTTTPAPAPTPTGPALDPPFVAIVESPRDRARADELAAGYRARGYDARILLSDDYPRWQPGVVVVYVAQFDERADGVAYCREEFGPDPRDCYVLDTRAR
jgi:hypothetical protein